MSEKSSSAVGVFAVTSPLVGRPVFAARRVGCRPSRRWPTTNRTPASASETIPSQASGLRAIPARKPTMPMADAPMSRKPTAACCNAAAGALGPGPPDREGDQYGADGSYGDGDGVLQHASRLRVSTSAHLRVVPDLTLTMGASSRDRSPHLTVSVGGRPRPPASGHVHGRRVRRPVDTHGLESQAVRVEPPSPP